MTTPREGQHARSAHLPPPHPAAVDHLVPMVHVAQVEASLAFYAMLGFERGDTLLDHAGAMRWAFATTRKRRAGGGPGEIMFARASGPIEPEQQAVLFYMYNDDDAGLRAHLLGQGLHDGGPYCGQQGPNAGRRVVFAVSRPEYMPQGEIRIADPDGYCILVGQYDGPQDRE